MLYNRLLHLSVMSHLEDTCALYLNLNHSKSCELEKLRGDAE